MNANAFEAVHPDDDWSVKFDERNKQNTVRGAVKLKHTHTCRSLLNNLGVLIYS